jgi:hypothetical protein
VVSFFGLLVFLGVFLGFFWGVAGSRVGVGLLALPRIGATLINQKENGIRRKKKRQQRPRRQIP